MCVALKKKRLLHISFLLKPGTCITHNPPEPESAEIQVCWQDQNSFPIMYETLLANFWNLLKLWIIIIIKKFYFLSVQTLWIFLELIWNQCLAVIGGVFYFVIIMHYTTQTCWRVFISVRCRNEGIREVGDDCGRKDAPVIGKVKCSGKIDLAFVRVAVAANKKSGCVCVFLPLIKTVVPFEC